MTVTPFDPDKLSRGKYALIRAAGAHRAACRRCRWLSPGLPDKDAAQAAGRDHWIDSHHRGGNP